MSDQPPILRYVGDDWTVGPVTLLADGVPVDLTGASVAALFYARDLAEPAATLTETPAPATGGVAVAIDRTLGRIDEVWIAAAVTSAVKPQDRRDTQFPTRAAVVVTDSLGRSRTFLIVLFQALDRRVDVPPAPA